MEPVIRLFAAEDYRIRIVIRDGDPWFIAADVCRALAIGPEQTRRLDADEHTLLSTQGMPGARNPWVNCHEAKDLVASRFHESGLPHPKVL